MSSRKSRKLVIIPCRTSLSLAVIAAIMIASFTLQSCKSTALIENRTFNENIDCTGESPEEYYWENERANDLNEKANEDIGQSFDGELRSLDPNATIDMYSVEALKCWSKKGSGFSSYLIALSISEISSLDDLSLDVIDRNKEAIYWLSIAARQSVCSGVPAEGREFFGCRTGLPEAKYWLSICHRDGLAGCRRDRSEFLQLCREARDQGSTLAALACRS
ncbi:hypothetical protein ACETKC_14590 [Brevundimonas intermedia]|uniref:hypothetical protein n=1 Tax=Brevundimonas intermedia TaxID=74315 RepID=UPI0022F28870|nr:hypothetical protein [Brevundimonas intermedia]